MLRKEWNDGKYWVGDKYNSLEIKVQADEELHCHKGYRDRRLQELKMTCDPLVDLNRMPLLHQKQKLLPEIKVVNMNSKLHELGGNVVVVNRAADRAACGGLWAACRCPNAWA